MRPCASVLTTIPVLVAGWGADLFGADKPVRRLDAITFGDWFCIGPFKDEAFGNVDRSLACRFEPEQDYFEALGINPDEADTRNLALSSKASSPDDVPIQGHKPDDAVDGSTSTYWDDQDGAKLYILQLDWGAPVTFDTVRITGWRHHDFAPKTFSLVADGKAIADVKNAVYQSNRYVVKFEKTKAKQLQLRVTGSYGGSPAVRELEVFKGPGQQARRDAEVIHPERVYRMKPFPGYLRLERKWARRTDWTDGYHNLLPRGPAPSRNETDYLYRTITAERDREITVHLRTVDFCKAWLNGEEVYRYTKLTGGSRYPRPRPILLSLKAGRNHLLIKNTSRWAEHGFSFGVEGVHAIQDPWYYDINAHDLTDPERALTYLRAFKFGPTPIPMYSPATYKLDEFLAALPSSEGAASYDRRLRALKEETLALLNHPDPGADRILAQARKIEGLLKDEIRKLPPILFIKRPFAAVNAIAPYQTSGSLPSSICLLDPSNPDVEPKTIFHDPALRIYDMCLSFDASTIYFSGRKGRYWHIYRIGVDGSGLKQLTTGDHYNISPCELPDGRIAFISTRRGTFVECQGRPSGLLFSMNAEGRDYRLLSANIDSDHTPRVLNDGRISFSRWDYGIEKNVFARHALWTVNPDGSGMQLFFGNTIEDPGAFWKGTPIPDRPELVCVLGPHHSYQAGMIGIVWNGRGTETPRGEGFRWVTREVPTYGDRTYHDGYQDPYPINEKLFLVSYGGMRHRTAAIPYRKDRKLAYAPLKLLYLDVYGNESIIYADPEKLSCYQPILLRPRKRPPVIHPVVPPVSWAYSDPETMNRLNDTTKTGALLVQDALIGISERVARSEVRYIQIMEQVQKSRRMVGGEAWGHTPLIGRGTVHVRRVLGTVPVEEDGSAFFEVPALRSISLNVLNAEKKTVMRMGSDLHVVPGEKLSCIGCHEVRENRGRAAAPAPDTAPLAARKPPAKLRPPDWGTEGLIDYIQVVQPVWDKHCIRCHRGPNPKGNVNMTSDRTRFFCQSYDHLVDRDIVDHLSVFSLDHDEGTPKTVGAIVSTIDRYLDQKHCESAVTPDERYRVYAWIDANVPYYGTYTYALLDGRVRGLGARDAWETTNRKVTWASREVHDTFKRRCFQCHQRPVLNQSWLIPVRMTVTSKVWGDKALTSHGFGRKWKVVNMIGPEFRINLTNPTHSLMLQAPLAKDAGGAGLCRQSDGSPVFRDKSDPDYIRILQAIEIGKERLYRFPRVDMMGKAALLDPECIPDVHVNR